VGRLGPPTPLRLHGRVRHDVYERLEHVWVVLSGPFTLGFGQRAARSTE
jgi:hypothetical protein